MKLKENVDYVVEDSAMFFCGKHPIVEEEMRKITKEMMENWGIKPVNPFETVNNKLYLGE